MAPAIAVAAPVELIRYHWRASRTVPLPQVPGGLLRKFPTAGVPVADGRPTTSIMPGVTPPSVYSRRLGVLAEMERTASLVDLPFSS